MSVLRETTNLHLTLYDSSGDLPSYLMHYSDDMGKLDEAYGNVDGRLIVLEETATAHDERLTNLETCCNDVNITLSSYGDRLIAIENVIATVSTQNINDIIARVDALENKVQTNSELIHELNDNFTDMNTRLGTAETQIRVNKTDIETVTGRVVILENCCAEVRETLRAFDLRISKNTDDISDILLRFERDESNITANAQDIIILSQQVETNSHNIDELTHALGDLDPTSQLEVVRQVSINTENIASLQDVTANHTAALNNVIVRFTEDELRITDLERRMTIAEDALAQVGDWQTTIDNLSAQVTEFSDVTIPSIENDVTALGVRVTALESFQSDTEAYETANNTRIAAVESRVTTNEGSINSLSARVTTLEGTDTTHTSQISALDGRLTTAEGDIDAIEAEIGNSDISGLGATITQAILRNSGEINGIKTLLGSGTLATIAQNVIGAINEVFGITGSTPLTTTAQDLTGAVNELKSAVDAISAFSFIGMIVESTTLATEADVKALFGSSTSWLQHSGYVLRGASTDVVANSAVADGGSDTVTPSGSADSHVLTSDEIPTHSHTIAHTHTMAHTHDWSNTHNHGITDPGHSHSIAAKQQTASTGYLFDVGSGNSSTRYTGTSSTGISINNKSISGTTTGASNSTTSAASATNSGSYGGGLGHTHSLTMNSHTNLPSYKNVYIWERVA